MNDLLTVQALPLASNIAATPRGSCPLCGEAGKRLYGGLTDWLFGVPGEWDMLLCRACQVAWLDPVPLASDIPKLYSRYYTHAVMPVTRLGLLRRATEQWVWARMGYPVDPPRRTLPRLLSRVRSCDRAAALEVLDLPASETGTLLDVGCGNGDLLARMRGFGWKVCGVDPDPAAVSHARSRGLEVFRGTICDVPGDGYDVISLNHVVEHVLDPVDLLRQCRDRLRPGTGRLVIATPNLNSLGHWWFKGCWRGLEVPRHLMLFSPLALGECVQQAGLHLHALGTETRLARMIYIPSVYAQRGIRDVGSGTNFRTRTKIAAYLFQALEDLLIGFRKNAGEEIFCICCAPGTGPRAGTE
jgi:2-polyprenyl-3-methyl-5-hydroxy-6-metoxy-1,4-benzoquinol methylase